MNAEPCIICNSTAQLHVDERRNRHVGCPTCGGYIATHEFAPHYEKCGEQTRADFASYMLKTREKDNRFLFKARPLKSNPYSASEGFEMLSISRILSGHL